MSKVGGEDDEVLGVGVAWSEYIERKLFFNKKNTKRYKEQYPNNTLGLQGGLHDQDSDQWNLNSVFFYLFVCLICVYVL